jgi:SAM-dependent methyltransferase
MPQQPPARVLDLGCGTGWTSDFLARSGYETTGIDLSPEAVEAAAATYPSQNLRFLVHDYEEPLGEEGTYDIALFFDALHHCTDVEAALKTAASALRHGGACVVSEPGRGHANSGTSVEARDLYDVTERDMPPEVVIAAARKAGFARSRVYPQPAEVQRLLYTPTGERRSGIRQLLDSRVGRSLLILRAMHLNRRRGGLVLLEL